MVTGDDSRCTVRPAYGRKAPALHDTRSSRPRASIVVAPQVGAGRSGETLKPSHRVRRLTNRLEESTTPSSVTPTSCRRASASDRGTATTTAAVRLAGVPSYVPLAWKYGLVTDQGSPGSITHPESSAAWKATVRSSGASPTTTVWPPVSW